MIPKDQLQDILEAFIDDLYDSSEGTRPSASDLMDFEDELMDLILKCFNIPAK